jgi:hypothetical protein
MRGVLVKKTVSSTQTALCKAVFSRPLRVSWIEEGGARAGPGADCRHVLAGQAGAAERRANTVASVRRRKTRSGGGRGQLLLLLLPGAEGGWLREEEPAQSAPGRHPGGPDEPVRSGGPRAGGVVLGREAGFVYTYSKCADLVPVTAVRFPRGAPGGAARRPGRGGGRPARGAPAGFCSHPLVELAGLVKAWAATACGR